MRSIYYEIDIRSDSIELLDPKEEGLTVRIELPHERSIWFRLNPDQPRELVFGPFNFEIVAEYSEGKLRWVDRTPGRQTLEDEFFNRMSPCTPQYPG